MRNKPATKNTWSSLKKTKHPERDFYVFVAVTKIDIPVQVVNNKRRVSYKACVPLALYVVKHSKSIFREQDGFVFILKSLAPVSTSFLRHSYFDLFR